MIMLNVSLINHNSEDNMNDSFTELYHGFLGSLRENWTISHGVDTTYFDCTFLLDNFDSIEFPEDYSLGVFRHEYTMNGIFKEGREYTHYPYVHLRDSKSIFSPKYCSFHDTTYKKIMRNLYYKFYQKYSDTFLIEDNVYSDALTKMVRPVIDYMKIPFTECGLLQGYFLHDMECLLPTMGHAYYKHKRLLTCRNDAIHFLPQYHAEKAIEIKSFSPIIHINDKEASISFYCYMDSEGVCQYTVKARKYGDTLRFADEALVPIIYDEMQTRVSL